MKAKQKVKKCDTCFSFKSIAKYSHKFGGNKMKDTCQDCIDNEKNKDEEFIYPIESFKCFIKTYEEHICDVITEKYNYRVTVDNLKEDNRKMAVAFARGLAMLHRYRNKKESQAMAASYYNRDHSTLVNARKVAYNMWDTDSNYRQVLQIIETRIGERIL